MKLGRRTAILLSAMGTLVLAAVLYLGFADLGRYKEQIEGLVTKQIGRPFAIDGALQIHLLPSVEVVAERIRLGNAQWGSQPEMVKVGRFALNIGLWSLISGPVDVRTLEVSDVVVLLEKNAEGRGNWEFGELSSEASAPAASPAVDSGAPVIPAVIQHAKLANVRVTFREPGKHERVALLHALSIDTGSAGLLAIAGKGSLNDLPTSVEGELGPLAALVSGRDIRVALRAALGELSVDANGALGRLDPLGGADLTLKIAHPDIGAMLKRLDLPVIASGPLAADARLADAGNLTRLDLAAKFG